MAPINDSTTNRQTVHDGFPNRVTGLLAGGMLSAIRLIETIGAENKRLSELSRVMTVLPQVLLNIDVQDKPELESIPQIMEAIHTVEAQLGEQGRVLVRYSGTQALCRVMVEGPDKEATQRFCQQIADVIRATIAT